MSTTQESLFEFPCTFPIKVMTENDAAMKDFVESTLQAHLLENSKYELYTRESSGGKYLSVTATFTAHSKEQLDKLYQALHAHEKVKMIL